MLKKLNSQTINILCTSKPVDGLLYYSYEYCSYLNSVGIPAKTIIICHHNFTQTDYINTIGKKYIHCNNIYFDADTTNSNDITLIMGRSMMTLAYINFNQYTQDQQNSLKTLLSKKIIAVYSENHPIEYPKALKFFMPSGIVDICDREVYPNGVGEHFEKTINFEIYKPYINNQQFKYLFLGTNEKYYTTVEKVIDQYADHGILTYNEKYVNIKNNNIFAPVENLMGLFDTYVYTKETFDPAPRILQECKYYNKNIIYLRDKEINDGGSVYWRRKIKPIDTSPIVSAVRKLQ